jgi:hypothetical protein
MPKHVIMCHTKGRNIDKVHVVSDEFGEPRKFNTDWAAQAVADELNKVMFNRLGVSFHYWVVEDILLVA